MFAQVVSQFSEAPPTTHCGPGGGGASGGGGGAVQVLMASLKMSGGEGGAAGDGGGGLEFAQGHSRTYPGWAAVHVHE